MAQHRFRVEDLKSATDPQWFARGERYFEQGRVSRLRYDQRGVSAVVDGSRNYLVRIDTSDGVLSDSCTCALGQDGYSWCKHAVAVALAWLATDRETTSSPPPPPDPELSAFLEDQDSAWLAEQLLRIADDQPAVLARLQAAAGTHTAVDTARDALYRAITGYTPDPDGWNPGDGGAEWLRQAIDTLDDLVEYGYEAEAAELAADAHALFDKTHEGYEDGHSERLREMGGLDSD
ncbi:SWIM zinc finger family protein [Halostreptopolyspora alba]|uniref:SWIM-type domain-containing protein n=1 Tax=Halostreptopolyspora alba TaxID=2487137 RepID=A0A3N0EAG3_9ACTN|nr:hypothetical protein EFW17_10565 [Nocardiopsaceae bacterium YIM 96095]